MKTTWKLGPITIRPYKLIPSCLAVIVAWIAFGWKAALIASLLTIDEADE